MSGAGNDFVVIDNREDIVVEPNFFAHRVCDRRRGIGADGILLLGKSDKADFKMEYYNSDGSCGGMCGNGGRCISRFSHLKGIVKAAELKFEAIGHIYSATIVNGEVNLRMKTPSDIKLNQQLQLAQSNVIFHFVNTGSPHCVIFLDENQHLAPSLQSLDVEKLGNEIRNHRYFSPDGTNVNFIEKIDSNNIKLRTYERGVEAETLACGTGSVAAAIISNHVKKVKPPVVVYTQSGEHLKVDFVKKDNDHYDDVSLFGSAHILFSGTMNYNFSTHTLVE